MRDDAVGGPVTAPAPPASPRRRRRLTERPVLVATILVLLLTVAWSWAYGRVPAVRHTVRLRVLLPGPRRPDRHRTGTAQERASDDHTTPRRRPPGPTWPPHRVHLGGAEPLRGSDQTSEADPARPTDNSGGPRSR